jgi:hypothetical protein
MLRGGLNILYHWEFSGDMSEHGPERVFLMIAGKSDTEWIAPLRQLLGSLRARRKGPIQSRIDDATGGGAEAW